MADQKITALTSLTAASTDDILPIVDSPGSSPVTKKITYANLIASFSAVGQLPFPATQSASADANTLDDYEEGSWTPGLTLATPGDLNVVTSVAAGRYIKIGKIALALFYIQTSTWTWSTASGGLFVTGLPFTSRNANPTGVGAVMTSGWTKTNYTQVTALVTNNATTASIVAVGSGQVVDSVQAANVPSGTQQRLQGSVIYEVA